MIVGRKTQSLEQLLVKLQYKSCVGCNFQLKYQSTAAAVSLASEDSVQEQQQKQPLSQPEPLNEAAKRYKKFLKVQKVALPLYHDRGTSYYDVSNMDMVGKAWAWWYGVNSEPQQRYIAAQKLWFAISEQCSDPVFYKVMGIPLEFQCSHSLFNLHMWILITRLRREGYGGKKLMQKTYEIYQEEVHKTVSDFVQVRLNKWLVELEQQFYGSATAYDKAIQAGGDELAVALKRNIYLGDRAKSEYANLMEEYTLRQLGGINRMAQVDFLNGDVKFSDVYVDRGTPLTEEDIAKQLETPPPPKQPARVSHPGFI
eukprot:TRINITY_DN7573_c1_g2_i1.p1 TRINITY_DN7573_c1_g2~~TRINITY_DN7573_c1_g2_i1.p1  ORF type:complete len:313 (+),score=39.03 TRINITY_DN7573_c1_g2_i1:30-968(+)